MSQFWNNFLLKFKSIPARKKALIIIFTIALVVLIIIFIWAISTGRIRPFAAGSQITNTATVTYQDPSGITHTANSNTVITDLIPSVNATLVLSPASGSFTNGSNFDVNIILNTGGQDTVSTDVIISYNPSQLEVIDSNSSVSGVQIQGGTLYPAEKLNTVDASAGKISYISGINIGDTARFNGTGTLATITFKGKQVVSATPANFNFSLNQTNDCNVVVENGTDILASVANGSYTIVPSQTTVNLNLSLQGRQYPDGSLNYDTANTSLKAFNPGTTTNPVLDKSDVTTDSDGNSTFNITSLSDGNYDFKIKVQNYLTKALTNKLYTSPLNLSFGELRAGDLNNDDIINTIDYAGLNANWGQPSSNADINLDGIVNSIDFALMNSNWFVQGQ